MIIFRKIEQFLYNLRNAFWSYPDALFIEKGSIFQQLSRYYGYTRPFSHFITFTLIILLTFAVISTDVGAFLRINKTTLIEGVIVGVNENGELQTLNRINPLVNTNIQMEKDLIELIYQSLIKVDQNGEQKNVMIEDLGVVEEGKLYRFKLKEDLYWHDGVHVTTEDVAATFALIQKLDKNASTSTLFSRAATKMEINVLDDYLFEFKLNSAIPAFFEAISFKILPAHLLGDLNPGNINTVDPFINRNPIGTGPYKLINVSDDSILLEQFDQYDGDMSSIRNIRFKMFADEGTAVEAIKSGQIHTLTGISTDYLREIQTLKQINVIGSNVIYNQYWGLYFNLSDNGPEALKDTEVRQAISSAINRSFILESLLGYAEEALGPIPVSSFAYSKVKNFRYNKEKAEKLLDEAGWKLPENSTVREKDGDKLSFSITLVDNEDRLKIAELIQKDLADVGIEVKIETRSRDAVVSDHIIPRIFDTLLYGVQTFIDPDRFELFHSSQIEHPGLNISSYASPDKVLTVVGGKTKRVPEVDDALDDARKILDEDARKREYELFQSLVAKDVPVVFLFHPVETYAANKRVKGIMLDEINSIEERFADISNWEININD